MIGAIIAKRKLRSAFDALNNHDLDKFLADWSDEATFIYPGDVSVSGEYKGKQAIKEWFRKMIKQCPEIHFTTQHVCLQNIFDMTGTNHVAVEWDVELTNKDGQQVRNRGVTRIDMKMGKAVLVMDYIFDLEAVKKEWGEDSNP